MRSPLVRATACPECGRRVCSLMRRINAFQAGKERTNCPYCGCPCHTPLPLYAVMLIVGAIAGYPVWRAGGGGESIVAVFLVGYMLAGIPLMVLFPLRARAGTRAVQPLVRIKRPFDYQADDVWHAARNVLRRCKADYQVLSAAPRRLELRIRRKSDGDRPARVFLAAVESAGDGGCRMVIQVPREREESDLWDMGSELEQVCQLTQEELERYSYPKTGPGGHT